MAPPAQTSAAIIVHDLGHALAALAAADALGAAVTLRSAPDAVSNLGAGVFRAIMEAGRRAYPHVAAHWVLDCGDAPGFALGALRIGIPAVRLRVGAAVLARVADIAAQLGAEIDRDDRPALDLHHLPDPEAACRRWLGGA